MFSVSSSDTVSPFTARTYTGNVLNFLKAFASPRREVRTLQLILLANALFRSVLEYALPICSSACVFSLKALDITYNSALRMTMDIPRWTLIFKLYRESGQLLVDVRRSFLTHKFFIRCAFTFY